MSQAGRRAERGQAGLGESVTTVHWCSWGWGGCNFLLGSFVFASFNPHVCSTPGSPEVRSRAPKRGRRAGIFEKDPGGSMEWGRGDEGEDEEMRPQQD